MRPHSTLVGISIGLCVSLGFFLALRATGSEPLAAFAISRGSVARWSHAVLAMGLILVLAVLLRGAGPWREFLSNRLRLAASLVGTVVAPLLAAWVWSASAGGSASDIDVTLGPILFVYLGAALLLAVALCVVSVGRTGQGTRVVGYGALVLFPLSAVAYLGVRAVTGPGVAPIIGGLVLAVLGVVTVGSCAFTSGPGRPLFVVVFACAWVALGRIAMG